MSRFYHKQGFTDKLSDGKFKSVIGGPVNCFSFDEDTGIYVPQRLIHANAENHGGGIVRHRGGAYGYDVNLNKGSVKVYPVRGSWSKFIEIFDPVPPDAFKVNQLAPEAVEYYIDYPGYRYSFIVNDQGFKTLITVNESYSDNGEFELGFRPVGLTIDGRDIKDGDTVIMTMPYAWLMDSAPGVPNIRAVGESYQANKVTITADLTGLVGKVYIDPSLGPVTPEADTMLWRANPTTNYGNNAQVQVFHSPPTSTLRAFYRWDISSIPAGSVISSASRSVVIAGELNSAGKQMGAHLLNSDKSDAWVEMEATWNDYKAGSAWDTGGGDYVASPFATDMGPFTGTFTLTGMEGGVQSALDEGNGIFSYMEKWANENINATYYYLAHSRHVGVPSNRPTLTVIYAAPSASAIPPHVFQRVR